MNIYFPRFSRGKRQFSGIASLQISGPRALNLRRNNTWSRTFGFAARLQQALQLKPFCVDPREPLTRIKWPSTASIISRSAQFRPPWLISESGLSLQALTEWECSRIISIGRLRGFQVRNADLCELRRCTDVRRSLVLDTAKPPPSDVILNSPSCRVHNSVLLDVTI
jgi:hypothetical protein